MHALVMAGVTILMMIIFRNRNFWFWLVLLSLPVVTELAQIPMLNRSFELNDIFHNYLGILLVYCIVKVWEEISPVIKRRVKIRRMFSKPKFKHAHEVINEYHRKVNQ